MTKKELLGVAAILLLVVIAIGLISHYGDRFIKDRFNAGEYLYRLPSTSASLITEENIRSGMPLALQKTQKDPSVWDVPPFSEWQPYDTNSQPPWIHFALSNHTDHSTLYVRVEGAGTNALKYQFNRGK